MTVLIVDSGLFVHWAECLARHFDRVLYFMNWKQMMPKSAQYYVGHGIPKVEHVHDLWDAIDDADLILFTDVGSGDLQEYLRGLGKNVWGPGHGEELELDREGLKALMAKKNMPSAKFETVVGVKALREKLATVQDRYLKVSLFRGDFETCHHENLILSSHMIDDLAFRLGPSQSLMRFMIEEPIPEASEIGYDGWCIDGQFPAENVLCGIEIKDCGYAGAIMPYAQLPKQAQWVNEQLADVFRYFRYRGFFSSEIRVPADNKAYLIDPCCRCGSPPSQLYQEMYSNWQDILVNGSQGIVIEPKVVKPYGVMAMICAGNAGIGEWQAIQYPKENEQWIKLRHKTVIDGTAWVAPQEVNFPEIGAVVGIGDTLMEAIEACCEHCEGVKGDSVHINTEAIPKAIDQIKEAMERHGMKFGNKPLPKMEAVRKAAT